MTKITNATPGPRGLYTKSGLVWVDGYQTVDAEFEEGQEQSALDTGWFTKGERNVPSGEDAADAAALRAEVDRLTRANAALETEVSRLTGELATAQAARSASGEYSVLDKGRGWFVIMQDGREVTKSVREDVVKDFDGLSDEDKAAFVTANNGE